MSSRRFDTVKITVEMRVAMSQYRGASRLIPQYAGSIAIFLYVVSILKLLRTFYLYKLYIKTFRTENSKIRKYIFLKKKNLQFKLLYHKRENVYL